MSSHLPFRKVFDGVAAREQIFQLFNRHKDTPGINQISGTPYAGEYFEIAAEQYHFMLALLPPLFQRTGMFGMSEFKAGNVTSVFSRSGSAVANGGSTASVTSPTNAVRTQCARRSLPMRRALSTA